MRLRYRPLGGESPPEQVATWRIEESPSSPTSRDIAVIGSRALFSAQSHAMGSDDGKVFHRPVSTEGVFA